MQSFYTISYNTFLKLQVEIEHYDINNLTSHNRVTRILA